MSKDLSSLTRVISQVKFYFAVFEFCRDNVPMYSYIFTWVKNKSTRQHKT